MHNHECRHCGEKFICSEPGDECFSRFIVCQECWWKHDFRHFVVFCGLALLAIGITLYFVHLNK